MAERTMTPVEVEIYYSEIALAGRFINGYWAGRLAYWDASAHEKSVIWRKHDCIDVDEKGRITHKWKNFHHGIFDEIMTFCADEARECQIAEIAYRICRAQTVKAIEFLARSDPVVELSEAQLIARNRWEASK